MYNLLMGLSGMVGYLLEILLIGFIDKVGQNLADWAFGE